MRKSFPSKLFDFLLRSYLTAFFELQSASFYKRGIELLPARWAKFVEKNGDYVVD
jgi:hypothetical protein